MSAGTQAPFHQPASHTRQTRLPWWAVVLPALAFAVLLGLLVGAPEAQAATGGPAAFAHFLEQLRDVLLHGSG
ncbi:MULTISPECIES: hypothetical protein [Streptomyces]|uniref:Uncharacterized protein n=1 Tax=Streptomyces lycii TaxID=2654337 RepID=A0ABQ7FJH0_9ACTN|nr:MULTISPECIES: hypothetical protein [Streptomyces]KAF4409136.1 hypothetical protein GCU69_10550 [Streptomyces lycii]PGH51070.1 hypothetical protein CRI70_08745 [Streptomyces sp. Ru87]